VKVEKKRPVVELLLATSLLAAEISYRMKGRKP